jgi:poly-gamma-glutamate capsule biosynthesis protein CapA/YwtB (metallophosphatase superfamily)
MASVLTDCGFNVVSVAGNHAMDWGAEPDVGGTDDLAAAAHRHDVRV